MITELLKIHKKTFNPDLLIEELGNFRVGVTIRYEGFRCDSLGYLSPDASCETPGLMKICFNPAISQAQIKSIDKILYRHHYLEKSKEQECQEKDKELITQMAKSYRNWPKLSEKEKFEIVELMLRSLVRSLRGDQI